MDLILFYWSSGVVFQMPPEETNLILHAFACEELDRSQLETFAAHDFARTIRKSGFKVACGCRGVNLEMPLHAVVLREKIPHLRQVNGTAHAFGCPIALGPVNSARKPNMKSDVRIGEIATRLRAPSQLMRRNRR
jgi:hypothetical protein